MKRLFILLASFFIIQNSNAQFGFEYSDSLVVKSGGDTLEMAWAGGLSHAQFSDFDYDFDGDLDLFVFDRSSNNIRVFSQENVAGNKFYKYVHDAQQFFPTDIMYRATMVDYDQDSKNDLFVYGIGGIKVYRNVGDAMNGIQWEVAKELLYSDNWGANLNLYVSSADIPAIADIDGDTDIDVLTYHIGGQHVQYHKNLSMETYGIPDSLIYELRNECWGGFREDINTNSVFLNDNTPPCAEGNFPDAELGTIPDRPEDLATEDNLYRKPTEQTPKHSGSTLLALDYDNNGVMDLILGDVAFNNLNLLINGGTAVNTNSDMISSDPLFPSNSAPVNLEVFPAGFYVDVDFDGAKDLIVGTNAKNITENQTSILYYKNTGTTDLPNFVFQSNAFLQELMIEHGTGGIPVLADINNDGLKDLFVGNFFRHKPGMLKESTIAYYKNSGTATAPVFTFFDDDFLNLSQTTYGLRLYPTFGDISGDGLLDLILGLENGTLVYYQNNSTLPSISFAAPVVGLTDNNGTVITTNEYAAPQLFDLNNDGMLDLILGKKTGEFVYYQNIGTSSSPVFKMMNSSLGNIDLAPSTPDGFSAPHFFRLNDTTHLFAGGSDGYLHYFNDIDGNIGVGASFNLVSDTYLGLNTGAYSSFFVDDVDNDNHLNLFAGQDLGGLHHFEVNPNSTVGITDETMNLNVSVYPNPTNDRIYLASEYKGILSISAFDLMGKDVLLSKEFIQTASIDLTSFPQGIYILRISDDHGNVVIKRVVKK